jgi:hypothetical protein
MIEGLLGFLLGLLAALALVFMLAAAEAEYGAETPTG